MPFGVHRRGPEEPPNGKYDLIIATGVLYPHYDVKTFFRLMKEHSSKIILTCNIAAWEHIEVAHRLNELSFLKGKEVHSELFPYREYQQQLRIFEL